jgi:hypothetical protein
MYSASEPTGYIGANEFQNLLNERVKSGDISRGYAQKATNMTNRAVAGKPIGGQKPVAKRGKSAEAASRTGVAPGRARATEAKAAKAERPAPKGSKATGTAKPAAGRARRPTK